MALVRLWSNLSTRKLWRWTAGYIAFAWVVLQALDLLGNHLAWPSQVFQAALITLAGGFACTIVLAWNHGERGRQRVSVGELLLLLAVGLTTLATIAFALRQPARVSAATPPGAGTAPAGGTRVRGRATVHQRGR